MEGIYDKVMAEKSDYELIQLVTIDSDKYKSEAIETAKKELDSRNIDPIKYQEVVEKLTIEKYTQHKIEEKLVPSSIRLVHSIVDLITLMILYFILASIVMLWFDLEQNKSTLPLLLLMILSFFINYAVMELMFQKTVGKFITKTKVVTLNGDKPSVNDILIRTLCRLIPFDRLSFLFTKSGFHDKISHTTVVKD